jgi:glycosyltransferase involved in cell wall biosynthesis
MNHMKLLLITTNFPRWEGDPHSPWLVALLNLLRKDGLQVDVLAPAHRGQGDHTIQGMRVHRFRYAPARWETLTHEEGAPNKIRVNPLYLLLVPLYVLAGLWAAWRMGRRDRYDLIHVYWPVPGGLFGLAARWASGGRLILTVLGAELVLARRFWFVAPFMKLVARRADEVAAISTFTCRELTLLTGVMPVLIPFGVSVPSESEMPAATEMQTGMILTVGRLIARKGQAYLVEAMALLADHTQAHLVIVGEGHERPALEATVERVGLASRVTLKGRVSNEELNRLYRACQVFVLPGIVDAAGDTEMLGMVLLEAMRYRKPVVCTRVGGTLDILTDNENGLLVAEKDPAGLAAAIRRLMDDASLADRFGRAGYATARDRFGWPEIVRRTKAIYGMP